jgi:hypothetical protein
MQRWADPLGIGGLVAIHINGNLVAVNNKM